MIDYKLFEFAAPVCTKEHWYIRASQLAGLGPGFSYRAHETWEHGTKSKVIRLSVVRNPVDWLIHFYETVRAGRSDINGSYKKLSKLDFRSVDRFFNSYLEDAQGEVTALYNRYEADVTHKAEDVPWAFTEFLDTLGVPNSMYRRIKTLPHTLVNPKPQGITVTPWLRQEIRKSESEVFERYDYW